MKHSHNTVAVRTRLKRIEGQVKGIAKMVEEDRECIDIFIQISAVSSALNNVARIIMEDHIEHCVVEGIKSGEQEETLENLKTVFAQFTRIP
ncbi:MAG: metal-sensitive transcriptional regulator [Christensenellales bacterium]